MLWKRSLNFKNSRNDQDQTTSGRAKPYSGLSCKHLGASSIVSRRARSPRMAVYQSSLSSESEKQTLSSVFVKHTSFSAGATEVSGSWRALPPGYIHRCFRRTFQSLQTLRNGSTQGFQILTHSISPACLGPFTSIPRRIIDGAFLQVSASVDPKANTFETVSLNSVEKKVMLAPFGSHSRFTVRPEAVLEAWSTMRQFFSLCRST